MHPRALQSGFFILLIALTTLAFFGLIRDFIMPIFWAIVLAVVFQPVHQWWLRRTKERSSLAAVLTIATIVVILVIPLALLGVALARETLLFYDRITTGEIDLTEPVARARELLPMLTGTLDRVGIELERIEAALANLVAAASRWIAQQALAVGQDAVRVTVLSALMLYVLFFFLRDGSRMLDGAVRTLPLGDDRERLLFAKFANVSRATIGGALVVSAVQGAIGGLIFWAVGISAPIFWGVVMGILSFLPAVGTGLVWGPAAIILALTGSPVRAVILIVLGILIIGLADNVLRPILVGRYARMPDFVILVSTLGGLATFGLTGVVIGPVIAAFFLTVWEMFAQEQTQSEGEAS